LATSCSSVWIRASLSWTSERNKAMSSSLETSAASADSARSVRSFFSHSRRTTREFRSSSSRLGELESRLTRPEGYLDWQFARIAIRSGFSVLPAAVSVGYSPCYRASHRRMSISGPTALSVILLMEKVSLLHVPSAGCATLAQSLHPVVKDAFQGYCFNAHQNVSDGLKKRVLVCELAS
jgi:hypothetical protein